MKRITRAATALGLSVGMMIGGGAVAQAAMSWGTLSVSFDGAVQGQGHGDAWQGDVHHARFSSTLRDLHVGHGQTYAELTGYGKAPQFVLQSGRRADGGGWAAMAVKEYKNSTALSGYRGQVKVCQDRNLLPDRCSPPAYGWL